MVEGYETREETLLAYVRAVRQKQVGGPNSFGLLVINVIK